MRRNTRNFLFLMMLMVVPGMLRAQQDPFYDQYQFNQLAFNPAYAGSKNALETSFFIHRQAVNILGAPSSESFTVHSPMANDKVGLGLKVYHDRIGVTNNTFFGLDYAYRAHINNNLVAAFGIEASLLNYSVDYAQLDGFNSGDPTFTNAKDSYIKPNFSAGFYLQSDVFYLGLSSVGLLSSGSDDNKIVDSLYDETFDQSNHIYINGGALLRASDNFAVKPNFLFKRTTNAPAQADLNVDFILYNTLLVGAGYRTNKSFSITAEYLFETDNLLTHHEFGLGYSYNTMMGDDAVFLSPSHEIYLLYRFHKHNTNIKNPRFF